MELLLHLYLFIIGAVLGSFFNVVGLRVPQGNSIVKPPSHCPNCQKRLRFLDLVPIFSYLVAVGKCRHCKVRISPLYFWIELVTGLLFAMTPLFVGWSYELFVALALISLLSIVVVSDLRYMLIPDRVLLFFLPLFVGSRLFVPLDPWWSPLAGAAAGFFLLYAIAVVSKGGMGGGDIKLFAVLGVPLGLQAVLLALFFSAIIGAIFGIIGIVAGKLERRKPLPFAPFIAVGTLIAYFFGHELYDWYVTILSSRLLN